MARIAEGRKAPDFTLEDALGRRVSLADVKGNDVGVYFSAQVLETVCRGAA